MPPTFAPHPLGCARHGARFQILMEPSTLPVARIPGNAGFHDEIVSSFACPFKYMILRGETNPASPAGREIGGPIKEFIGAG
jgi:hypothetical protein